MRKTFASATDLRERGIPSRNTLAAYEMTPQMSWGGFLVKNLRKVEYPRMRFQKPTVPTLWPPSASRLPQVSEVITWGTSSDQILAGSYFLSQNLSEIS